MRMLTDGMMLRLDTRGDGVRVSVKDLIDMVGIPTTAGSLAVARTARPAARDAACLAGVRAAGARIVGRTAMHELAYGISGINAWQGTPTNPLDASRVPGGSSSGAAVSVATGAADVALGSDTGGSVRIPAACCGVAGLKTTWGRIALDGVWPLAPSLDTIGPLARDVAGLVLGMQLLEPGFTPIDRAVRIGRLPVPAHPEIDDALTRALGGLDVVAVPELLDGWATATPAGGVLLGAEAWRQHGPLVSAAGDAIGPDVLARFGAGELATAAEVEAAGRVRDRWRAQLADAFTRVEVLALPTLGDEPAPLEDLQRLYASRLTLPVNLAGLPAVSLPVPRPGALPASLQLVGPAGSEELLLGLAAAIEAGLR